MVQLMLEGDMPNHRQILLLDIIQQAQKFAEIPNHQIFGKIGRIINASSTSSFLYQQLPLPALLYQQLPLPAASSTSSYLYQQLPLPAASSTSSYLYQQLPLPAEQMKRQKLSKNGWITKQIEGCLRPQGAP